MSNTSTKHIGPDEKRIPIPRDIEWFYSYIKGDLHCATCGELIEENYWEHNTDKGYDLTEYLKPIREAHRCTNSKSKAKTINTPVHHENEARTSNELPKLFG